MQTLSWLLFESRLVLLAVLFLANFFLLVRWRRGGSARPLLIMLGVSAAVLIVNAAVVTHREHAVAIMGRVERAVLSADADALGRELAPDFAAGDMDRAAFVEYVREQFRQVAVRTVAQLGFDVRAGTSSQFETVVAYIATIDAQRYSGLLQSEWRITFRRDGSRWRISRIEPLTIGRESVPTWRDVP